MKPICALLFVVLVTIAGAFAQALPANSLINGGILNGRAVTLPTPEYPESARQACIGGLVSVHVVIDESGMVISAIADPIDQHITDFERPKLDPTLIEAAEYAARRATFKPFHLKGQPVKITGQLDYNFVADNSDLPPRIGEIFGPLLNSRAVQLPDPEWPAVIPPRKGPPNITVYVTVDETGKVVSAKATSGTPELRTAVEAAALKAEFKPDMFLGEPIQLRGIIQYQFPTSK